MCIIFKGEAHHDESEEKGYCIENNLENLADRLWRLKIGDERGLKSFVS